MSWDKAACADDPDKWFPTGEGKQHGQSRADAVLICRTRCPIQGDCADLALETHRVTGIWGGVDLGIDARRQLPARLRKQLEDVVAEAKR